MEALFTYRDWKADPESIPDWDNPGKALLSELAFGPHTVRPKPNCLADHYIENPGDSHQLEAPVIYTSLHGEPTAIAVPCQEHVADFVYEPGWYLRFSNAESQRRHQQFGNPESGALPPVRTCGQCGNEFAQWLWGWGSTNCANCSYLRATGIKGPDDAVLALIN